MTSASRACAWSAIVTQIVSGRACCESATTCQLVSRYPSAAITNPVPL